MTVQIRYFAAAKAALGTGAQSLDAAGTTIGDLLDARAAEAPAPSEAAAVVARCSFLHNGTATTDRATRLADADTLDVLPPFAGG
ncbi:MAG: MoaD/ThiS family protein [Herbiconiux sp.]|nr:MoaD/ThiS family protein [Herbiconiux sp.]